MKTFFLYSKKTCSLKYNQFYPKFIQISENEKHKTDHFIIQKELFHVFFLSLAEKNTCYSFKFSETFNKILCKLKSLHVWICLIRKTRGKSVILTFYDRKKFSSFFDLDDTNMASFESGVQLNLNEICQIIRIFNIQRTFLFENFLQMNLCGNI